MLASLLRTVSPAAVRADLRARRDLTVQQTCSGVQATPNFSEYYGSVSLDGAVAPAGTLVEAYSPRGDKVGCVQVSIPGFYPYMRVYGQDGPTPGMRDGESVTFKVGGNLATTDPSPVIWANDWDQHQVNLTATTGVCYDLDHSYVVDIGDITLIAAAWRTTAYDFNGNGVVDVGDIMMVAAHWGEPGSC